MPSFSWIPSLTGLRAVAVLAVTLGHDPVISTYLFGPLHIHAGGIGVSVFFVLSGFLAYFVLRRDEINRGKISWSFFLFRRVLRIWPAYFVVVLSTLVYLNITGLWEQTTFLPAVDPLLTFTSNLHLAFYTNTTVSFLAPLWTIAVEEQFYLIAPLLFKAIRSRYLIPFVIFILFVSNGSRLFFFDYFSKFSGSGGVYFLTTSYLDLFVAGMLLSHYYLAGKLPKFNAITQEVYFFLSIGILIIAGILWGRSTIPPYQWFSFLPYFLLTVGGFGVIYSLLPFNNTISIKIFSSKPLQIIGLLSFSIYLVHTFVIAQVGYLPLNPWQTPYRFFGLTAWILGLSSVIYLCIERPFLILKKRRPQQFRFEWPVILTLSVVIFGFYNFSVEMNIHKPVSAKEEALNLIEKGKVSSITDFAFNNTEGKVVVDCQSANNPLVLVALGQSNIANYNDELIQTPKSNILNFNPFDGQCYEATDPLLGNSGVGGSSLTVIGHKLGEEFKSRTIVLVPLAMGASRVRDWARRGKYNILIKLAEIKLANTGVKPSAYIWQQGESEIGYQDINGHQYAKELRDVILHIRKFDSSAPFIVSQSTICFGDSSQRQMSVSKGVKLIASEKELNAFIGPDFDKLGNQYRRDGCHFNEAGVREQTDLWIRSIKQALK